MAFNTFGKRLRVLRVDRGLSQIELRAEIERDYGVEMGETYISELERTERMPSLKIAAAIAKKLDISLDYLALLIDEPVSYVREEKPAYFHEESEVAATLVDKMRPDQRMFILTTARNLLTLHDERQRKEDQWLRVLDSVERQGGRDARERLKTILRSEGFPVDDEA